MDLSILIVNWSSVAYLRRCLFSIYANVKGLRFEVIVIDNASYDGSAAMVNQEFSDVIFVQSDENLGFARANNVAYRSSSAPVLLFLNPDTEVFAGVVERMHSHLLSHSKAGIVGCHVLNTDLTPQTQYVQAFPTICNQLLTANMLVRLWPISKLGSLRPQRQHPGEAVEVDVLAGSCLMIKQAVFEQVQLFSEDYFMYAEDVDLCYKVKQAGYLVQYVNGRIIHHVGKSSKAEEGSHFSSVLQKESLFLFFRKTRGKYYAGLFKATTAGAALIRLSLILGVMPLRRFVTSKKRLHSAFQKWRTLLRWSFGCADLQVALPNVSRPSRNT